MVVIVGLVTSVGDLGTTIDANLVMVNSNSEQQRDASPYSTSCDRFTIWYRQPPSRYWWWSFSFCFDWTMATAR
jgi:hypothetical protein